MSNYQSSEWAQLRIHWPGPGVPCNLTVPMSGGAAHRLAAKAVAASEGDPRCHVGPALFHHEMTESGARITRNGLSPFRYHGGPHSMTVTAVGFEAVDALEQYGHRLTRCVSAMVGRPLKESWTRGKVRVGATGRLHRYFIPYMIVTRKPLRKIEVGNDLERGEITPAVREWVSGRILDGVVSQAHLLGLEAPAEDTLLRVSDVAGTCGFLRGGAYYGSVAKGVTFDTELQLSGPWAVGHLCLLGEGAIYRAHAEDMRAVA